MFLEKCHDLINGHLHWCCFGQGGGLRRWFESSDPFPGTTTCLLTGAPIICYSETLGALVRLFRYLRNDAWPVAWSVLFMLIGTGVNLVQPKIVERAVDFGITQGELRSVVIAALALLGAAILSGGLHMASGVLLVRAGQGMGYQLRNDLFAKIMSFSFGNLDRWRTGELLVRANSDVNTVRRFVRLGLLMMLQSILMLTGSLIVMYRTNAQLSVVMLIILPGTLLLFFALAIFIRPMIMKSRTHLDGINNALQENLAGAKVVRAFARQAYEEERFGVRNRDFLKLSLRVGYTIALAFPLLFFLGQLAVVLVSWLGGTAVIENTLNPVAGGLSLGQLVAFNEYALLSMWPIISLGMTLQFLTMASASAVRIEELRNEQPDITDSESARVVERFRGEITFRDVSFAYGGGENAVEGVSLTVHAGEKLGVLGRTGAGKSSLAALIPRYYDVTSGAMLIDGMNVREIALDSLRSRITVALQETVLMAGTILDNVAYAYRRGTAAGDAASAADAVVVPTAAVLRAAEIACAREFIEEKEHGWNEPVGERGAGLSGGQRQRIAIARALLSDPDILILDDVTSSVDAQTEKSIVSNLYAALKEETVIIISQKINTVMLADRIIVMENGRIIGEGSHDELVKTNQTYRDIYNTQSAEIRA